MPHMARSKAAKVAADVAQAVASAVDAAEAGDDDADDQDERGEMGPLFHLPSDGKRTHERTRVDRLEPLHEGFLDHVSADASEEDVRDRWGGGKYEFFALDQTSKTMARRTVKISGDPIFESLTSQRAYDRWVTQRYGKDNPTAAPAATDGVADNAAEERHRRTLERIRLEIEAKEQAEERRRSREREERREEREREEAARKAEREERDAREDRRLAAEREAREREWKARMEVEDARRKDEREARDRERDERRADRAEAKDPTAMLVQGMQLAMSMGGGGEPPDAMTAFLTKAPELLQGAKEILASGGPSPGRAGNGQQRPAAPAGKKGPDPIVIDATDPLGKEIYRKAAALGPNGAQAVYQAMRKAVGDIATPEAPKVPEAAAKPSKRPGRPAMRPSAKVGKAKR